MRGFINVLFFDLIGGFYIFLSQAIVKYSHLSVVCSRHDFNGITGNAIRLMLVVVLPIACFAVFAPPSSSLGCPFVRISVVRSGRLSIVFTCNAA